MIIGIIVITIIFFTQIFTMKVEYGSELVTIKSPTISFMIMNDISDEVIIKKIQENTFYLNEECTDCKFISDRTPLITAVAYKRTELIKYMVKNGVSIEKNKQILADDGPEEFLQFLNESINGDK